MCRATAPRRAPVAPWASPNGFRREKLMARVPVIDVAQLNTEDKAILDRIVAVRPTAATAGPFTVLMHRPKLADRVAALEDYFREGSTVLSGADRELIVLATVRETGARYPRVR